MLALCVNPRQQEYVGHQDPQCQGFRKGGEVSVLKGFVFILDLVFSKVR